MSLASQSLPSSGMLPSSGTLPATGTFITRSAHETLEVKRDLPGTVASSPSSPSMGLMSTTTKSSSQQSPSAPPRENHSQSNDEPHREKQRDSSSAQPTDHPNDRPSSRASDHSNNHSNNRVSDHPNDHPNDGSSRRVDAYSSDSRNDSNDQQNTPHGQQNSANDQQNDIPSEHRDHIKTEQDNNGDSQSDGEQSNTSRASQDSQASHSSSFLSIQGRDVKDAPRKRRRTTPNELHILEAEFSRNNRPGKMDRERIAKLTSMDEKAVQVWFQNKRQSHRRQHNLVTPAAVRTQSMPLFHDENNYMPMAPFPFGAVNTANNAFQAMLQANAQKFMTNQVLFDESSQPKSAKSLKLSMSADGKAELIERSPLKQLSTNQDTSNPTAFPGYNAVPQPAPASRFASMPTYQQPITGIEQECASSLLVLKFGKWR